MYEEDPQPISPERARQAMDVLQGAFGTLMGRIAEYILEHEEDVRSGGFALNEVLDRYGMQLMSFGTLFSNLRSFAEDGGSPAEPPDEPEE